MPCLFIRDIPQKGAGSPKTPKKSIFLASIFYLTFHICFKNISFGTPFWTILDQMAKIGPRCPIWRFCTTTASVWPKKSRTNQDSQQIAYLSRTSHCKMLSVRLRDGYGATFWVPKILLPLPLKTKTARKTQRERSVTAKVPKIATIMAKFRTSVGEKRS